MKLDLDWRLTLGFAFGLVGLTIELVGSLLGLPVSDALVGGFFTLIIATFGIGIATSSRDNRKN